MRSDRWIWPGTYSRPAEPIPFMRPKLPPFFETHRRPFEVSVTYGIRSLSLLRACEVKRSGGSQIKSIWQSAEMTSYFIACSSLPVWEYTRTVLLMGLEFFLASQYVYH